MIINVNKSFDMLEKIYTVLPESGMPHDEYIEKLVLCQLISLGCIEKSKDILHEDLFYSTDHKTIFKAILKAYEKNRIVNLESVNAEVPKELRFEITEISWMTSIISDHLNNIFHLKEIHIWRRSIQFSYWIITAFGEKKDVFEVSSIIDKMNKVIKNEIEISQTKPIYKLAAETLKLIQDNSHRKDALIGIDTGYEKLNNLTSGWEKSNLIILAARPSMGKTTLALNLMLNAAKDNVNVVFFSLETKDNEIMRKLMSNISGIPYEAIRHNDIKNWQLLNQKTGEIGEMPILIEDVPGITIEKLDSRITKLRKIGKCDLAIVDYLQLMNIDDPQEKKANRESQIRYISNSLKKISSLNEIPVIGIAQLNREVEKRADKRPMLSDLRESGSIEQDADIVMFLYRDSVYNQETEDKNIGELIIAKQRNGKLGKIKLKERLDICKFENIL